MLGPDVGGAELARLLVGREQGSLGVRGQRGRDVRALGFLRLLLELGRNRVGLGAGLLEDVADDIVLERAEEQVVALEVEAPPLERRLRGPLEELTGGVAEELGDVDALGAAPPGERSKKSEKNSSKRLRLPPSLPDIRSSARSISQRYSTSCVPSGRSRTLDATAGRPWRWHRCCSAMSKPPCRGLTWTCPSSPCDNHRSRGLGCNDPAR
jgi:hypothetical protein